MKPQKIGSIIDGCIMIVAAITIAILRFSYDSQKERANALDRQVNILSGQIQTLSGSLYDCQYTSEIRFQQTLNALRDAIPE